MWRATRQHPRIAGRWPWRRGPARQATGGPDLTTDHGHWPFTAWEAELTAYARLRTRSALVVRFAIATQVGWSEEIHLARPDPRQPAAAAFAGAELELEHLLVHHRQGWREVVLFWHTWAHPTEPTRLPWAPWDRVGLPPAVVRAALAEALPALTLPAGVAAWRGRLRDAARWIAAAWADGAHRSIEVAARPGMADRLPLPPCAARPSAWELALYRLATGDASVAAAPSGLQGAVEALAGVEAADPGRHVAAVLEVVDILARRNALPPSHQQRPRWLRPDWGRWRREDALRAALARLARSPDTKEIAGATAAGRAHRALMPSGDRGQGTLASWLRAADRAAADAEPAAAARATAPEADAGDANHAWGVQGQEALPEGRRVPGTDPAAVGREGAGDAGPALRGSGAGPGTLGALHVVSPTAHDRAAYWQLRGALAPEIEQLVERLRAAGDEHRLIAPRRFQRAGRLDRHRLAAAAAGREAVFTQFVPRPAPAHALCLLLDCSASMVTRAEHLRQAAILVESAAAAVGAQVSAFTFGPAWERLEPAAEGAPLVALGRELRPQGGTPFGPALAAAAAWLALQPYAQKRLWVFSDGQWSARDRTDTAWRARDLRDVVVWVLGETAPDPPSPAMRVVAAPALAQLVQLAPAYFWRAGRAP